MCLQVADDVNDLFVHETVGVVAPQVLSTSAVSYDVHARLAFRSAQLVVARVVLVGRRRMV